MRQATPLAIPYEQPRVEYAMGASPPLTYAIPWIFWTLDQDLQAVIVDATGEHPLVYGTDYTVAGTASSDPTSSYYVNGTITLLSSGWSNCTLTLWRLPLLRRLFDISETGPLDVHTLNAQLDQIVTTLQDLMLRINAQYGRDYTELGNSFPAFTLPTPQDGYLLGWLGQNLINQAPNAVAYGPAGPTGPTGPSGNPGTIGPTGPGSTASGPTGPAGPAGPQGFDGAIGATGAAGTIGPTGPGNPYIVVTNLVTNPPDVNNPPLAPPTGLLVADTSVADFTGYPTGPTGPVGPTGPAGSSVAGPVGPGVPVGGATGQALVKNTAANYDTGWSGPMLPLTGGTVTGQLVLTNTAAPQLVLNPASGNAALYLNVAAGNERDIFGQTASSNRWQLILGNSTAEGGGNVGSDLVISRFSDTGVALDTPLVITRSTGVTAFSHTVQAYAYQCRAGISGAYRANQFNIDFTGSVAQLWIDATNFGTFAFTSDHRIKRAVAPLPSMWERAKALRPVSYKHKDYTPAGAVEPLILGDDKERWGFVAHELQDTLIEDAAHGSKDEENIIQSPNVWTVMATVVKALQEAQSRIEALETKVQVLEAAR